MKKLLYLMLALSLMIAPVLTPARAEPPVALAQPAHWDLSRLGDTMAYAQMYDMLVNPGSYMGTTVKMQGRYYGAVLEDTAQTFHLIMVSDIGLCCEIGMEFILTGEHGPEDFPQNDAVIELTGLFGSIQEGEYTYPVLRVNEIVVVQGG